jgi:hypothetical protein
MQSIIKLTGDLLFEEKQHLGDCGLGRRPPIIAPPEKPIITFRRIL